MAVSDFLDLMPDTVTYRAVTSRDNYGLPSYGSASSYRARVVYKTLRTTSMSSGQEVLAAGEVWLAGTPSPPDIDDKITLPDGSTPKILNFERFTDEAGVHHTKILFGGTGFGGQK
jgi:hypothetical protein